MEHSNSLDELPREKWWGGSIDDLYQYEGFWYRIPVLSAVISAKSHFMARDDDVILSSSMKTGTTWLKALIPSIVTFNCSDHDDDNDPLLRNHPNMLTPSLEFQIYSQENPDAYLSGMSSPRLIRTHIPYTMLPDSIRNSGCKIVYITRNPKDTFVSLWYFLNKKVALAQKPPFPFDEAFDSFVKGVHMYGPFHDHVLEYYNESLKRPEKILFLKYEDMKTDPRGQIRKLASFLGKPLVRDEDVDKILWRCSLERLKNLEVNKNGKDQYFGVSLDSYFRRGIVGDWKNHMSPEMGEKLDKITRLKFQGTGLDH